MFNFIDILTCDQNRMPDIPSYSVLSGKVSLYVSFLMRIFKAQKASANRYIETPTPPKTNKDSFGLFEKKKKVAIAGHFLMFTR